MAMKRAICCVLQTGHRFLSPIFIRNRLNVHRCKSSEVIKTNMPTFGKPLIDLPVTTKLKLSGEKVIVENLSEKDLTEAFQLIATAAERGDNVGVDEYRNVGDFLEDIRFGSVFTIRNPGSGSIDAVMMLGPCLASRTIRPCLASLQVVTSEGFARESVWRDCFEMAVGYARRKPFGFSACVTEVFAHCIDRITALRKDGFVICASVPRAGRIVNETGKSPIHMHSYLMYKEIGHADNKRPCLSEFVEFSTEFSNIIENKGQTYDGRNAPESTPVPPIPGFPAEYYLTRASMPVTARQLDGKPEDMDRFYDFYRLAGEEDEGYSIEEFPTTELFWSLYKSNYNIVFEEKNSGKWVAVINIGHSLFVRTRGDTDVYDAGLIIAKDFRNAGLGTQLLEILLTIARQVGCRVLYSDAPIYDTASIAISLKNDCSYSGTLPCAIYSPTYGWSDVILMSRTLDKVPDVQVSSL